MTGKIELKQGQLVETVVPTLAMVEALTRQVAEQLPNPYREPMQSSLTWVVLPAEDGTLRVGGTENLISVDPAAIVEHLNRAPPRLGIRISYAVKYASGEVIEIVKNGKLTQRDVNPWVADGFTEWLASSVWPGNTFRLPTGRIVSLAYKVDASPTTLLVEALKRKGLLS